MLTLTSTATQEQITEFLARYIAHWPRSPYWSSAMYYGDNWATDSVARSITTGDLAQQLLMDAEFRTLQLGTWLNSPDGELITAAAEAITPPPYREDIDLLVEALKIAAQCQRSEGIKRALLTSGFAAGLTLLVATSKN